MASTQETRSCLTCNESTSRVCNRCHSACYCSQKCQTKDWPIHKILCASFSEFDMQSRPTKDHIRAIHFPVDAEKPQLIWLDTDWDDSEEEYIGGKFQQPNFRPLLAGGSTPRDSALFYNSNSGRDLTNVVYICHRDNFLVDGSLNNNSVASITATNPGYVYGWRGPFVAYSKVGVDSEPPLCRDIDMSDFRHVADHFLIQNRRKRDPIQRYSKVPPETKVKGVKINCKGDREIFGKPHFETIEISTLDPIFTRHDTSDVADRVGIPIFTRRCPPSPEWAAHTKYISLENLGATYLHVCRDPKAEFDPANSGIFGWGWAPHQWDQSVGNAIVVRQDKKPLDLLHVEALCNYCQFEIGPLFVHVEEGWDGQDPLSYDDVLDMISKPTFRLYWLRFREETIKKRGKAIVPSPYDV